MLGFLMFSGESKENIGNKKVGKIFSGASNYPIKLLQLVNKFNALQQSQSVLPILIKNDRLTNFYHS